MTDAYNRRNEFGWRAFARYNLNADGHDLYVAYRDHDKAVWSVAPLTFKENPTGAVLDEPMIGDALGWSLEGGKANDVRGFLRCLVDVAWDMGIRPTKLAEHQSELTAVRYHLEDMRALAKVPTR